MAINQIHLANTFQQLLTVISGLIGITNYLTDGPLLLANSELKLTKAGTTLNVSDTLKVNNEVTVGGTFSVPSLNVTSINTSANLTTSSLNVVSLTSGTLLTQSITGTDGSANLTTLNVTTGNVTTMNATSVNVTGGRITIHTLNTSSLNVTSGVVTLSTINATIANITALQANISNATITTLQANVSNCNVTNVTFVTSTLVGVTKSNVGLSNVDNTSDSTKNSATANLTNKTFHSPLIITGNVSADPVSSMQIASLQYANVSHIIENAIINGSMEIWQRGNTFASSTGNQIIKVADCWKYQSTVDTTGVVTIRRSTNVPTFANAGVIFNYSLEVDVTTAEATLGTVDYYSVWTPIEGYNWAPFAQRTITLSFWVMSTKTGTHCIALLNSGSDKYYVAPYIINTSDTWEYKTITIPASPSDGTWNYTTGYGAVIYWTLGAGATFNAAVSSTWTTGTAWATSNQVNVLDSTSNFFRLTGVKLEVGSVATPLKLRPWEKEYDLCRRYFQKSFVYTITPNTAIGANTGEYMYPSRVGASATGKTDKINFAVRMRDTNPAVTTYNPVSNNSQARNETRSEDCASISAVAPSETGFYIQYQTSGSTQVGDIIGIHWTADKAL